ncbi:MAG: LUD domain-containing protein [Candidatus Methanoperedens sp.]|nr:LUD domain-containing protein [Candidatus Methanoperedens sp.]
MKHEEVRALRKAFKSVKERQDLNHLNDIYARSRRLMSSRELCVGNEILLEEAVMNLRKNGIKVHLANTKQEALDIILDEVAKEKLIVKSKSNVTKELELTKYLEKKGITVVETDIGDRILQVMDQKPSHPTGPVTHLSAKEIAKGISKYYGIQVKETPEEIVKIVKGDILSSLEKANVGITGANAVTSEEGSIILTHNEGNINEVMRKQKHIIVTSIDKLYPDIESAMNMLKILSFNATGSIIPSFVNVITGVTKTADVEKKFIRGIHNPSETILVLINNRRREFVEKGFKELLYCIGCGNCLLHCPMYNTIGNEYAIDSYLGGKGLAYHSIYSGESDGKLELCLGCGKCKENCPLKLDVPEMITKLRSKGTSSEIYFFLKSHILWVYYQALLRSNSE